MGSGYFPQQYPYENTLMIFLWDRADFLNTILMGSDRSLWQDYVEYFDAMSVHT